MKKITKVTYNLIKIAFERQVHLGMLPSLKVQGRSKKRRAFYKELGLEYNVYEGTIRRVVKSKNYAEYLRLGRENRGTSTKRKNLADFYKQATTAALEGNGTQTWVYTPPKPKPKKYKTTIISTDVPDIRLKSIEDDPGILSYTVEVLQ